MSSFTQSITKSAASLTPERRSRSTVTDSDRFVVYPAQLPGGQLFCLFLAEHGDQDEILALDAQTLQPRLRFGLSLLKGAYGLAVVGEELFLCDSGNDRLQVFSLAGEHRRSITGEWKQPLVLCFVKDRLYLIEEYDKDEDEDEEGELINPQQGRRIFVLSLQGDLLQRCKSTRTQSRVSLQRCFDGKLLVAVQDIEGDSVEGGGLARCVIVDYG